ncbi:MAG: NAD(P)H-dependent oxidoreductase [Candidatus Saccharibacteria bacterium]|nr:NAD(P)H-dependent oxidoreductase [Candidatus Saccharibacteria bacterium]
MNILVISASMRGGSQSFKVAEWLSDHVVSFGLESSVLDLHEVKLPLFDDGETEAENLSQILNDLKSADGYVFVSPEWNGMMSHGLINMLHFVENKEMAYKPVMLVGVSAGRGGTHPIDQMKVLGQKNRHYVISPENLIANGIEKAFNSPDLNSDESDFVLKERADYSLKVLVELASSLSQVRQSGVLNFERFSNGV